MCFDGVALARAQYERANFRISPELFIFFGARSFIADKGVVLVHSNQSADSLAVFFIGKLHPSYQVLLYWTIVGV